MTTDPALPKAPEGKERKETSAPAGPRKRRSRWRRLRRTLRFGCVVIGLAPIGFVAVLLPLLPVLMRYGAPLALSLILRRPVSIGNVELGWHTIELSDVDIANAPGFSFPRFAGAKRLELEPDWGALLRGRLRAVSIRAEEPQFYLEIDADRKKNLPRSGRPRTTPPRTASEILQILFHRFEIGHLTIVNGTYAMRLARQDLELRVPNFDAELRRGSDGSSYDIESMKATGIRIRVARRLETRGSVEITGARADANGARADRIVVDLEDGTRVEASGSVLRNFANPELEIQPRAVVQLRDLARALKLPLDLAGTARLEAVLHGPARHLQVSAHLEAPDFEAGKEGQRLHGQAKQVTGELEVEGTVIRARNLDFSAFGGEVHLDGEVELAREKRSLRMSIIQRGGQLLPLLRQLHLPLELDGTWSAVAEIQNEGFRKETTRGRATLLFDRPAGELPNLYAPASSEGAGPEKAGPAESVSSAGATSEGSAQIAELLALASELAARESQARAELGQEERFSLRAIRDTRLKDLRDQPLPLAGKASVSLAEGEVFIESSDLDIAGSQIELIGKIGLDKTFDLAFRGRSDDVGVLAYAARPYLLFKKIDAYPWTIGRGKGVVSGRLRGSTKDPVLDGDFEIERGLYQRFAFDKLSGKVHFEDNQIGVSATLVDGDSTLRATTRIVNGTKGHLQDLRSPFLSLDWLSLLPDMEVDVETDNYSLPRLANQLGFGLPGSLHLRGTAHLSKLKEQLSATARLEGLRDGYLAGQAVEGLEIAARVDGRRFHLERLHGSLNGSPVNASGVFELPSRVAMDMDLGPLEIEPLIKLAKLPVPISGKASVVLAMEGILPQPVLRFSLTTKDFGIKGVPKPPGETNLDLAIREGQLLVEGHLLGNSIALSGAVALRSPFEAGFDVNLKDASLSPLLGLVSPKLAEFIGGALSGKFRLEGPLARLRLLRMEGALTDAALQLTEVKVKNEAPVQVVLENGVFEILPVRFSGTAGSFFAQASYQVRGPFDLHVKGIANLILLKDFDTSGVFETVTGKGDVDVRVHAAPLQVPAIVGKAIVSDGYLKLTTLDQAIAPISGTIYLNYPDFSVPPEAPLRAMFGGGPVEAWGTVVANSARFEDILLDLRMRGTRLSYIYMPELETIVSPDVTIGGTALLPLVSGNLVMDRVRYSGRIELRDMLVEAAKEQTTGVLIKPRTQLTEQEIQATTIDPVLDLKVQFPSGMLVDSRGVDLRVTSPGLRVVGTYLRTGLLGSLSLEEEGKISYEDREFTVQGGTVEFLDPTRLNPSLSLKLEGQVGEHDITIDVSGTAEAPVTKFQSVPPMPELDVLSTILRGAPGKYTVDTSTGAEEERSRSQEQLVGAAATFLELDDAVFRRVGNILAADRFLVDPVITESGLQGARITWGKTVGKVDVIASQMLPASEPPTVILRFQVSNHIFVEGRNQGGTLEDTDIDLKFRWEFP